MLMGQVLGIALSIIGFLLALQGLWLLCRAMWPRRVQRAADRCRRHGVFCFLLGLPVTGLLVVIVMISGGLGTFGQIAAWVAGGFFLMYAGTGLSGFVTYLGERLESPADIGRPWRGTVRGGIALELAYLLPIIGWFGLLPASVILGAGATTLSFFGSRWRRTSLASGATPLPEDRSQSIELPRELPVESLR